MFKFNFKVEECDENNENKLFCDKNEEKAKQNSGADGMLSAYEAELFELRNDDEILDILDICELNSKEIQVGTSTLKYVLPKHILSNVIKSDAEKQDIGKADSDHTDLIPGIYEGGAKVWECTHDLLYYLAESCKDQSWSNKLVLDLGCGCGLLGIYALAHGAHVHFQDYNKDVLEKITIPNVLINSSKETKIEVLADVKQRASFYSGDWSKFSKLIENKHKYDFILTSETIYNPANQQKLLDALCSTLKPDGVIYLAAKIYYFGVGGGIRQFQDVIKSDGNMISEVVWHSSEGVSREILELKFKIND